MPEQRDLVADLSRIEPTAEVLAVKANAEIGYYASHGADLVADLKEIGAREHASLSAQEESDARNSDLSTAQLHVEDAAALAGFAEAGRYEDDQDRRESAYLETHRVKPDAIDAEPDTQAQPAQQAPAGG